MKSEVGGQKLEISIKFASGCSGNMRAPNELQGRREATSAGIKETSQQFKQENQKDEEKQNKSLV